MEYLDEESIESNNKRVFCHLKKGYEYFYMNIHTFLKWGGKWHYRPLKGGCVRFLIFVCFINCVDKNHGHRQS